MPRSKPLTAALILLLLTTAARAADNAETLFPAPNTPAACPDSPLHLTFTSPVSLGAGQVKIFDASNNTLIETIDVTPPAPPAPPAPPPAAATGPATTRQAARPSLPLLPTKTVNLGGPIRYYPVIPTGNQISLYPATPFAYGHTYYITTDAGAFKTADGPTPAITGDQAWHFTIKPTAPAANTAKLTIAADGSGDFCTVQGAIDSIPTDNTTPTTLFIKKGTYREIIAFSNKHNLTLMGEDRKQSIIEYANNSVFNAGRRGIFMAGRCNDLTLANLTFRNTTPQGGSQAETLILSGTPTARATIANCDFYSYQDTLQINGQAYIANCYIEGDVDFMWGNGPSFWENCECKTLRTKGYYAQVRNRAPTHGFVYHKCTFDGGPGIESNALNRIVPSAFPDSEVVLIDCTLTTAVSPRGWLLDRGATDPLNIHFWEYNSRDPQGNPIDITQRIPSSKQLKSPEDDELIKNYSNPTWVLGNNWTPKLPAIPSP